MYLTVEKCIEGWTNSLKQLKVKADVVFFGDSLTYFGDFSSVFPDKTVCNLGLRGDTIQGMINRIDQVLLVRPDMVYLMAGINDVSNCEADEFQERFDALMVALKELLSSTEIIVQSLLPVNNVDFSVSCNNEQITRCNMTINSLCLKYEFKYIDLYNLYAENDLLPKDMTVDGIHLYPCVYNAWYNKLKS